MVTRKSRCDVNDGFPSPSFFDGQKVIFNEFIKKLAKLPFD